MSGATGRDRWTLIGPAWPYRGGIAHFQLATARALAARGHTVEAVTFRRQYPERLFPGTSQFEDGPPPSDRPPAPRLLDPLDPRTWLQAARHVADSGADVTVLMVWMPFFAPMVGVVARRLRKRGVRVLAVVHNALPHERRLGDRLLTRFALAGCDGLVVLSDAVAADVAGLGVTAPVRQVPHPVYDGFGEPVARDHARAALAGAVPGGVALPADAPVFLFFGFIRRYKGLHVLLDAWAEVVRQRPDAVLVVAGEFYADEDAIRQQAAALGGSVRLDAGYLPDDRIPLYFSAADAVVQPYLSATQSGVAQIAFHYGRPVITTDVGGLAETVPDGVAGLVVSPDDPAALADALVRFVQEGMGPNLEAGARGQQVTWDRLADVLEGLAEGGR